MPTLQDDDLRSQEDAFSDIARNFGNETEHPLGDKEAQAVEAPDRSEQSALDQTRERLGLGYTGEGSQRSNQLSRLWKSNSKIKKKIAIAGAVAGMSTAGSVLIFLALLPLKIEQIVTTIENHYSAGIDNAMNKQADNFVSEYFRERIMPNLSKRGCKSTIDANCASFSPGSGPFDRFYNAWAQSGFERKLAKDYGMSMGYKNGSYYISYPGIANTRLTESEMKDFTAARKGVFDLGEKAGITQIERKHIRSVLYYEIAQETFMKRVLMRYKINAYLAKKFAIKRCVIACQIRDNYADKSQNLKRATWAFLIRHTIQPMSDNYGLMAQCLIAGNTCDATLKNLKSGGSGGDLMITSEFEGEVRDNLEKYVAAYGADTLESLLKDANKISEQGMSKFLMSKVASKIVGQEVTAEALDKVLGPVGIAKTAAQIVSFINNVGPMISKLRYITYAAGAVSIYTTYATMADEAKSGHTNAAAMGSAADLLGPEVKDDNGHQADISVTPIYNQIFNTSGSSTAASMFSFLGLVSADGSQSIYVCDDGKPVPKSAGACPEESGVGVDLAPSHVTNAAKKIPGWGGVAATADSFNTVLNGDYNPLNWISNEFGHVAQIIPGVGKIGEKFMSLLNPIMGGLSALYKIGWSAHMTGGRTGTAIAAGASITHNDVCQVSLGCAVITPKQAATIRNEQIDQDKEVFNSQSMFARIFSTTSQYSLVSRMAIAMPTNAGTFSTNISSSLSNPIHTISSAFGSLLSPRNVFADTPAQKDPFTLERGYVSIPKNPHAYWEQNCVNGPLAKYDQGSDILDVSEWVKNQKQDPDTGQAYATTPNPCMLIHTTLQSMGGMYDTTLLPKDNEDSSASDTPATVPSGTAMQLAKEILESDNISFATVDGRNVRPDYQQIADTGSQTDCGGVAISPDLLGIIVALSKNYHITVGVMDNGHHCARTYHSKGLAVDINGVGPVGKPTQLTFHGSDFNDPLAKQFVSDASQLISAAGGGHIGQKQCFSNPPTLASGVTFMSDTCSHIHLDIGGGAE